MIRLAVPTVAPDSSTKTPASNPGKTVGTKFRAPTRALDSGADSSANSGTNARAQFDHSGIALPAKLPNTLVSLVPGFLGSLPRSLPGPSLPSLEAVPSGFDSLALASYASKEPLEWFPFRFRCEYPGPSLPPLRWFPFPVLARCLRVPPRES